MVPRLVLKLRGDWADSTVALPRGAWTSVLTSDRYEGGRDVAVSELTSRFPVAVLKRTAD